MAMLEIIAIVLTLAAAFSYVNGRLLKLPPTIALMLMSLAVSLVVLALQSVIPQLGAQAEDLVRSVHFSELLLEGMLGFLLFAGALHVNLDDLAANKWPITVFATVGVVGSTAPVGGAMCLVSWWLGLGLPPIMCFLFGALISPTDPIAVLAILKKVGAPRHLETKITGESLFNDGIGVVVFLTLLAVAKGHDLSVGQAGWVFVTEVAGGALLGLAGGYLAYRLLKSIDNYQVEIMLTLALVTGGYALATRLHLSGPIAMVVAGLLIGNHGRRLAMSTKTREHLDTFWELVDGILNAVLFVLIGLEVLVLTFEGRHLLAGAIAVPMVLLARLVCVGAGVSLMSRRQQFAPGAVRILTWGGLRGGISVALALSLPLGRHREVVLTMTYLVVAFSILVQGLTVGVLIRRMRQAPVG